jgi:fibronectin type 3 domain-containing protein
VNISSASVSGTGFSLSGSGGSETLTPDQTQKYTVNFDPKAGGNASGTLTINSNAPNSPMKISLSGTGTSSSPDTAHTVALNWNSSKSSVIGYNVYRGTKSSGPYTKLNGSVNTSTSYSDSSVSGGKEYYYVVTAVNSEHVESTDSNQVAVTIPND